MVEGEQDDPVFLRQVMENYKLKVSEWGKAEGRKWGYEKKRKDEWRGDKVKKKDGGGR